MGSFRHAIVDSPVCSACRSVVPVDVREWNFTVWLNRQIVALELALWLSSACIQALEILRQIPWRRSKPWRKRSRNGQPIDAEGEREIGAGAA